NSIPARFTAATAAPAYGNAPVKELHRGRAKLHRTAILPLRSKAPRFTA
ncbi:hypothetical protein A2U01_0045853, partial [Trifolium medium]|nr:hypothetical protein [Trifolium medium]